MALFIIRFVVFSGLLYLTYLVLFSKKSFFHWNRAILILIPAISIFIPLVSPMFTSPFESEPVINSLLPEVVITGTIYEQPVNQVRGFNYWWLLYALGALSIVSILIYGLIRAWSILRSSSHAFDNVRFSDNASGPFAFFETIIIPTDLAKSSELASVLAHEKAHVDQKHAIDKLYYNILSALFWFNPFMYLLQAEMRQTHECLADEAALSASDPESYSKLLLGSVFGAEISLDPANRFFNSSLIKTRITMIYKAKTKPMMKGLYALLLPLITVMSISACQKTDDVVDQATKATELSIDKVDMVPLYPDCDANASKEDRMACFKTGIMTYIMENFQYPTSAKETGLEGKIFVEFKINKNGETEVLGFKSKFEGENVDPTAAADAENFANDLVAALPDMEPAMHEGKAVEIIMTLPIVLKME